MARGSGEAADPLVADMRHVVCGRCTSTEGTQRYVTEFEAAIDRVARAVPRVVKEASAAGWREVAAAMGPVGSWCPARRVVVAAAAGAAAMKEGNAPTDAQ